MFTFEFYNGEDENVDQFKIKMRNTIKFRDITNHEEEGIFNMLILTIFFQYLTCFLPTVCSPDCVFT